LPYLDQTPLYTDLNPDLITPNGPPINAWTTQPLAVYLCPSDPARQVTSPAAWYDGYAYSNYACNRAIFGPDVNTTVPANFTLVQITDGTSNTLMVGERDGFHSFAAVWSAAFHNNFSSASFEGRPGSGLDSVYNAAGPFPPVNTDNPFNYAARLEWSSMHPGQVGFAFADGSVHFLSKNLGCDPTDTWDDAAWATHNNFLLQNLYWPTDGNSVDDTLFQ
jgi:prepilin-type processing-associated H-X9-DG protein